MLGSSHDAEDAVQETLLRGWRGVDRFEGRSSLRTWLYTVATNVCLREIERRGRRLVPVDLGPAADPADGFAPLTETAWLGPLPDAGITWESSPADAVYEQREAVELGFIAALQHLPALQRAVLVLRDVLAFSAVETAEILDTTVPSVTSALARARGTVRTALPERSQQEVLREVGDRQVRATVAAFIAAWERSDVDAVVALLAEDVEMSMPPYAEWYRGRAAVAAFLAETPLRPGRRWRLEPTTANGQPALSFSRLGRADRGVPHPRPVGAHLRARRHHGLHHLPGPGGGALTPVPTLAAMALPDGVAIRRAVPGDAEALAHLHLDVWDDAYTGLMPQGILDDRREKVDERVERWRDILGQERPTWVAEDADGLVGFSGVGPARDNDVDIDLELYALYVRAAYYGTGVGYALFEQAVGDRAAYLWVLAGNDRAIGFYERQGFRLDGTEDEHDEGRHVRMVRAGT